jgi:hypothetical protein
MAIENPAAVPKLKRPQGAIRPRVANHLNEVGTTIIAQVRPLRSGLMVFPVPGSLEIDLCGYWRELDVFPRAR